MAQEREIATVWDRLQFLLSVDDDARWRVIGSTIIIVGACGSINFTLLDSSTEDVVFLMGALILLVSISQIGWYCSFRRPLVRRNPVRSISRRTLALQAGAFIAFILSLRLPHSEARTIERK